MGDGSTTRPTGSSYVLTSTECDHMHCLPLLCKLRVHVESAYKDHPSKRQPADSTQAGGLGAQQLALTDCIPRWRCHPGRWTRHCTPYGCWFGQQRAEHPGRPRSAWSQKRTDLPSLMIDFSLTGAPYPSITYDVSPDVPNRQKSIALLLNGTCALSQERKQCCRAVRGLAQ